MPAPNKGRIVIQNLKKQLRRGTLLTHREWVSLTKRLLHTRTLSTSDLIAAFERVAVRVERAIPVGINDWHLVQTWYLLSLEQACAGDYRAAAATLKRIVDHHQVLLMEHRRAYVAGAAAAAMELWKAGDITGARRMLQNAERLGQGLKPQEALTSVWSRRRVSVIPILERPGAAAHAPVVSQRRRALLRRPVDDCFCLLHD
jgi:hypothetical protein